VFDRGVGLPTIIRAADVGVLAETGVDAATGSRLRPAPDLSAAPVEVRRTIEATASFPVLTETPAIGPASCGSLQTPTSPTFGEAGASQVRRITTGSGSAKIG